MPRDDRRQEAAQPVIHSSFSSIPRIIVASCLPTLVSLPPAFVTPLTTLTSFLNLRYERPEGTSWETNKGSDKTRVGRNCKKRGFKLSLPWFSVRLTASSRDHLRSLRFTLFSAVSLGDRREPVVAGKVTHDQGYPLLGAKGNDMEDRNLGFKLFLVLGALVVLPASFTLIHSLTAPFVSWFGSFLTFPLVTRSGSERSERGTEGAVNSRGSWD